METRPIQITRLRKFRSLVAETGSQAELSRKTGIAEQYISAIGKGRRQIGDDIADRLEAATGKDPGWMDIDDPEGYVEATHMPDRKVPVISWLRAGRLCESMSLDLVDEDTTTYINVDASEVGAAAFALRVRGDGMVDPGGGKSYPDGCLIVVDPGRPPKPGNRVIVKLATADEPVFKQLEFDGAQYFLKPLNPRYPIMAMPADAQIIGVVALTYIPE